MSPKLSFSPSWNLLGPFQIGTREAAWGADPLEKHGGFHNLEYDAAATFASSLARNATVKWSKLDFECLTPNDSQAEAHINAKFSDIDWEFARYIYGWDSLQWQGWVRGQIEVHSSEVVKATLRTDFIIEYWIDDEHHFGGDFYGLRHAPLTLKLTPGFHRIDLRLVRDVRAFGGIGDPTLEAKLELKLLNPNSEPIFVDHALVADVIQTEKRFLSSPFASVSVRNDAETTIVVCGIKKLNESNDIKLLLDRPIRVTPGQTRPIGFAITGTLDDHDQIDLRLDYTFVNSSEIKSTLFTLRPRIIDSIYIPHKTTHVHPSGIVSYAILRPPSQTALRNCVERPFLPMLVFLHGAGVDADAEEMRHGLDEFPDLCAWVVIPSGVTPWCGDDWHVWGSADVEAAVASTRDWADRRKWDGAAPDISQWIVVGHSNGGQGVWYALTHRLDKVLAAAPLSGYSSIQTYVPYSLWSVSESTREAVVQSSLLNYRHELLVDNAQGVPIYIQHGSKDDNVPVYHSRLMKQRLDQVGIESTFNEIPDMPHWWDGILSTQALGSFLKANLPPNGPVAHTNLPSKFSIVTANPGQTGAKHGFKIEQIFEPGSLARLDFSYDYISETCTCLTKNVLQFSVTPLFQNKCKILLVDGRSYDVSSFSQTEQTLIDLTQSRSGVTVESDGRLPQWRKPSQQGGLEAILNSKGAFQIVPHSRSAHKIALQISRNLCQYFSADTAIAEDYEDAINAGTGNIISVAIGSDLPPSARPKLPIETSESRLRLHTPDGTLRDFEDIGHGLAAVFVRPPQLLGDRLELVVWGIDEASLAVAARLVPMITGTGQPDFVILDQTMMWKGVEGVRAMGFFTTYWAVSRNSFI